MKRSSSGPNRLRTLRRSLGLTQKELALLLGYRHDSQVSRVERGAGVPGLGESIKIELLFGERASVVFGRLAELVLRELITQIEQLHETLRSGCLVQVDDKADRLADVLVSLRNQDGPTVARKRWEITEIGESES